MKTPALRDAEPDGSMWFAVEHLASVVLPADIGNKASDGLQLVKVSSRGWRVDRDTTRDRT